MQVLGRLSTELTVLGTRRSSCCWSHCYKRHGGNDRWVHGDAKRPEDKGILFKKQNVRVFARLQAFLSPLRDAENPVSRTQPSYTQEFRVILQIFSYKALRGDSQGNGIWVKCQTDPVTCRDNGADLIKCNTMLYQLRSCVGRLKKYREGTQVCQSLRIPPSALAYKKELLLCSQVPLSIWEWTLEFSLVPLAYL